METLLDMRTYRMGLIQTSDQLQFSVDAIVQGLKTLEIEKSVVSRGAVNGKRLKENDTDDNEEDDQSNQKMKKRKNSPSS